MQDSILEKIQASLTSLSRHCIARNPVYFMDHPLQQPQTIELQTILAVWKNQEEPKEVKKESIKKMPRYKKHSFSLKKQVVQQIKDQMKQSQSSLNSHINSTAKEFGIHPKNINRWIRQGKISKKESGRKPKYPDLQEKLRVFIEGNPDAKRRHIMKKAEELKQELKLEGDFNFSKGWYERFLERKRKIEEKNVEESEWEFSITKNETE